MDSSRLPHIDAALILETVGLEVFRDQFGMRQCLERGIGPRRKKLGAVPPQPIRFVPPLGKQAEDLTLVMAVELARDEARVLLAAMCEACPFKHCRMKGFGVTPSPSSKRGASSR
jgi:hypothetical protein